jgi:hypothetical protein
MARPRLWLICVLLCALPAPDATKFFSGLQFFSSDTEIPHSETKIPASEISITILGIVVSPVGNTVPLSGIANSALGNAVSEQENCRSEGEKPTFFCGKYQKRRLLWVALISTQQILKNLSGPEVDPRPGFVVLLKPHNNIRRRCQPLKTWLNLEGQDSIFTARALDEIIPRINLIIYLKVDTIVVLLALSTLKDNVVGKYHQTFRTGRMREPKPRRSRRGKACPRRA